MTPSDAIDLLPLLTELDIGEWDAIVIGDGSGSTWDKGCGWASCLLDQASAQRFFFCGGCSRGTVHVGELHAYVDPLLWYTQNLGKEHLKQKAYHPGSSAACMHVHILTDSENVANQGERRQQRKANKALWAAMDSFAADGYALHWHWVARSRTALNKWADQRSRRIRVSIEAIDKMFESVDT